MTGADLTFLEADRIDALEVFWRESFPLQPLTRELLRERVFGPPDARPERSPVFVDSRGRILGLALAVPPGAGAFDTTGLADDPPARVGGIRWLGVHPSARGEGLGSRLLDAALSILSRESADYADMLSTPPFYIQPGVDIRHTEAIAWLLRRGFEHYRTNMNMTTDLVRYEPPAEDRIFAPDTNGVSVRRALPEDREAFLEYCAEHWNPHWGREAAQGIAHDPASLFLAVRPGGGEGKDPAEEIVGFAAYETNQCTGCFGPTGVSPEVQGTGLGRRLLHATLADMKRLGRTYSEIGWVGPIDFYHRACGAELGPTFLALRRRIER